MNIVFTGTFYFADEHITRDRLRAMAEHAGHVVEPRIGPTTEVLVIGDTGRHGITRKVMDALATGVRPMEPEDFMSLVHVEFA